MSLQVNQCIYVPLTYTLTFYLKVCLFVLLCGSRKCPYPPQGDYWKFQGWGGSQKPNFSKNMGTQGVQELFFCVKCRR